MVKLNLFILLQPENFFQKTALVDESSDDHLLCLLRNPETSRYGFGLLVRNYQEKIYYLVRRMLISHDDTNDVVQNIFLKIWMNHTSFRGEASLYTWIYRITVNETISVLRKKRNFLFLPIHDYEHELSESLECDTWFDGDQAALKLQKAILRLPVKQRLVFNLKYFEEMPYEEMSRILGTSVGALKASYHYATKRLNNI